MKFVSTTNTIEGTISGIAACYWLIYASVWTYTCIKAHKERKLPLPLIGKSFYVIAFLYEICAVAYFSMHCLYQYWDTAILSIVTKVCLVIYLPQAYLMGMGCSMGYGTLYTRLSNKRIGVLVGIWSAIFIASVFSVMPESGLMNAAAAILIGGFAFQIVIAVHTLWLLYRKWRRYKEDKYEADAWRLHVSIRQFQLILPLCVLLFAIDTADDLADIEKLSEAEHAVLWTAFVLTTTVVNSWILILLRPNEKVGDIATIGARLEPLNASLGASS